MHNGLKTQWALSLTQPVDQREENTSIHCSGKEHNIWVLQPEIIVAEFIDKLPVEHNFIF